jgi:hypothetical protein
MYFSPVTSHISPFFAVGVVGVVGVLGECIPITLRNLGTWPVENL